MFVFFLILSVIVILLIQLCVFRTCLVSFTQRCNTNQFLTLTQNYRKLPLLLDMFSIVCVCVCVACLSTSSASYASVPVATAQSDTQLIFASTREIPLVLFIHTINITHRLRQMM